ncbi:triple tyrosine motif-containing protein [uncultured Polaribacter sp.]|uniref:helix-turn-helix and ligand-binding sensor domain-containing protein n=1 Tax=uncultured Polaribacter sp. TaxID=174711 RepID=UPI00262DA7FD|nr:triple tyrosine motif-containing protein [uncultured Polaribacter sp.]
MGTQKKYLFFSFLLITSFFQSLNSQKIPPIQVYTSKDYKAENQNWAISQNKTGFIYVANSKGLLEFNGASWNLFETPNQTIMRSVLAHKNKIFTGFYMDFGFWKKNSFGDFKFTSLVNQLNIKMLEDEQVWNILELDGWILFKSLKRVYLYNLETSQVKIIEVKNRLQKIANVNGVIYFQEINKGVFKIENGKPKLVSNHQLVKENLIIDFFKKDNQLLFLTEEKGFYTLNQNQINKWNIEANEILEQKKIYSVKKLLDGSFAIGTVSNGLIYLNKNGTVNYNVTQADGLSNNTILSVFEDRDKNIWLGLDNGINYINNTDAFKMYNRKIDFLGTIYTTIVFKEKLYLGTNQGLFYREINSDKPFKFLEKTEGQVWNLTIINNTLFCGHNSGTFIISDTKANTIFNISGTWSFYKINDATILQGCYDGLYVLKKINKRWQLSNKIAGFNTSSKSLVSINKNNFFINHEYKGVFNVTLDKDYKRVLKVSKENSLEKGMHSSMIKYQNKILYAVKEGVFIYNENEHTFKKDSVYSQLFSDNNFLSAKLINDKAKNRVWLFSKNSIKYLFPGKLSNKVNIKKIYIEESIPKAVSGYENILHLKHEKYLIGTSNGYLEVDLNAIKKPENFEVHINKIENFITDETSKKIKLSESKTFLNKENNFIFSYSVPYFNKINKTKYQYQLVGFNKGWSVAQNKNSVLFKNIPFGDYTFKVRAIIEGTVSGNEATYNFSVKKPWYISNFMLVIYVLLSLLAFYLVHVLSKNYYAKQKQEMLEKANKEAALKELESSQKIIKLNNDKLRVDIESKNRELATSTMSIIKKNEFLNTIKNELISGKGKNITNVVKIIDTNLNNTDDWKLFQEAFNNADKKFLDKIKAKHPELTPNDLRLCAYLRLNLSSKEIAPLLNISPRSVEVKRYRIRKKMNLNHNANLTNYILEI